MDKAVALAVVFLWQRHETLYFVDLYCFSKHLATQNTKFHLYMKLSLLFSTFYFKMMNLVKEEIQRLCGKQYQCAQEMGSLVTKQTCMLVSWITVVSTSFDFCIFYFLYTFFVFFFIIWFNFHWTIIWCSHQINL